MRVAPICPFCGDLMEFRYAMLRYGPYREDQWWKCPRCFNVQIFGIPLSERKYNELRERYGSDAFLPEKLDDERMREHLRRLGYIL